MANCLDGNHPELRLDIIEHAVLAGRGGASLREGIYSVSYSARKSSFGDQEFAEHHRIRMVDREAPHGRSPARGPRSGAEHPSGCPIAADNSSGFGLQNGDERSCRDKNIADAMYTVV